MRTRWLYHVVPRREAPPPGEGHTPATFEQEGFAHCSFLPRAAESARLYFTAADDVVVLQIDPRRVARVDVVETPRGPMPHLPDPIPAAAIVAVLSLSDLANAHDALA